MHLRGPTVCDSVRADRVKLHVRQVGLIAMDEQQLDLSAVAQLVAVSQTRAIAEALLLLRQVCSPGTSANKSPSPLWRIDGGAADARPTAGSLLRPRPMFSPATRKRLCKVLSLYSSAHGCRHFLERAECFLIQYLRPSWP